MKSRRLTVESYMQKKIVQYEQKLLGNGEGGKYFQSMHINDRLIMINVE